MQRFLLVIVFWLAACGLAPRAWAFRFLPRDDFYSNYEMVKAADAIVLARSSQALPPLQDRARPNLRFEIIRVIKGDYQSKTLESWVVSTDDKKYIGRSEPGDFSEARPGAYAGMGEPGDYRLNAEYLLLLSKRRIEANEPRSESEKVGDVKWEIGLQPLSRDREEVDGETDPWTQAVRRYAEIAGLHDYEKEKLALAELRRNAAAGTDASRFPAALVTDIDRHFAAASSPKSYADLKALYDAATEERRRNAAVYAMAAAKYPQAFDLIYQRFGSQEIEYFAAVRDPRGIAILAEQFHKQKRLRAQNQDSNSDWHIASLLASVATRRNSALMMSALRAANNPRDHESEVLARWFVQHRPPETMALLREIVGKDYSEKWRVAESLAMLGDQGVVQWAQRTFHSTDYLLPVYALGYSPLAEADRTAARIIASRDPRRIDILVYAYRDENARYNLHRWERLRQIAVLRIKGRQGTGAQTPKSSPKPSPKSPPISRKSAKLQVAGAKIAS